MFNVEADPKKFPRKARIVTCKHILGPNVLGDSQKGRVQLHLFTIEYVMTDDHDRNP